MPGDGVPHAHHQQPELVDSLLRIELLPAGHGDSILIEYGGPQGIHRALIDGGPASSYSHISARIAQLSPQQRRFELLVITHIDADHIEGVLKLLNDKDLDAGFGDIWFNGYRHLPKDELKAAHGEMLSAIIETRRLPWNTSFRGGPVQADQSGRLPCVELPGGLRLTLLTPGRDELARLRKVWEREICRAGLVPGSTREALELLEAGRRLRPLDSYLGAPELDVAQLASARSDTDVSAPNASSIGFLAEYAGRSILLTGDATPPVLAAAIQHLLSERGVARLQLDALKVPHHGSQNNLTAALVRMLPARYYLFSTDGKHFQHPDAQAVARVVMGAPRGAELVFNYRTKLNEIWDAPRLRTRHGYSTRYPQDGQAGVAIDL
jgi:beta-lactamase superfamily II metal-dependent hydrolase